MVISRNIRESQVPGRIRPGGRRERVVELPSGARHVKEPSFLDPCDHSPTAKASVNQPLHRPRRTDS